MPYVAGGREKILSHSSWSETTESVGPLLELLGSNSTRLNVSELAYKPDSCLISAYEICLMLTEAAPTHRCLPLQKQLSPAEPGSHLI